MTLGSAVQRSFSAAKEPGRIGAEVEIFALDPESRRPLGRRLVANLNDRFVRRARPSIEPGGQLELSLSARPSIDDLSAEIDWCLARLGEANVDLYLSGTDPFHSVGDVPLALTTPRYLAMQSLFDSNGRDGRRMMRLTASLQVCVDLLAGPEGREQWLVANLAGPALTALYANSPVFDGIPNGLPGNRTRIWLGVDPARTGYDGRHLDLDDPIGAYAEFALRAERLPIPAAEDPSYHLTTLFPPVRPRGGYLEIRYLDAQPLGEVRLALDLIWTLMYERTVRRQALELLTPRIDQMSVLWAQAAEGVSPDLADLMAIVAHSPSGAPVSDLVPA